MERTNVIRALWNAVAEQDGEAMARFFTKDALVLWPNTDERFTLGEYMQANCTYPGQWSGQVEQIAPDGSASVARVWDGEGAAFRAVSFYRWRGERICRLEEYWGDVAPAPAWRQKLRLGTPPGDGDACLPSANAVGRCGFCCGVCPTFLSGECAGCDAAHQRGDCFTRDCAAERGLSFCTQCEAFPCGELLTREKATVLDRDWLRWKRRG